MGDLYDRLKGKQQAAPQDDGGFSLGGLLKNAVGDIGEIAQGLGMMATATTHDLAYNPFMEAATLGKHDSTFVLDDLAKAAPSAIIDDYKRRYGFEGLDTALEANYEDPLAIVGDIATVLSAGGYGAAKGAQAAGRSAQASGRAVPKLAQKILPGLAEGAGAPLGGTRQVVAPSGRALETVERAFNPTRRIFHEKVIDPILTKSPEKLAKKLPSLEGPDKELLANTIDIARSGNARVRRTYVNTLKQRSVINKMLGTRGAHHVGERNKAMRPYEEIAQRIPDDVADDFHFLQQGVKPYENGAQRLSFDEIVQTISDPATLENPAGRATAEALFPRLKQMQDMANDPSVDPLDLEYERRVIERVAGERFARMKAGIDDEVADVMDDFALVNFAQEAAVLPAKVIFERAYMPLRIMHGARWNKVTKTFEGGPDALMLDDMLRAKGVKAPWYFPHHDTLGLNKSDFLMPWRLFGMRRSAKPKGYKKSHGALFERFADNGEVLYETDPSEAYRRRAAEVVKMEEVASFLDDMIVDSGFGRPITAVEELAKNERVMNLDGVKLRLRKRLESMEALEDALESGADVETAVIRSIEEAFPDVAEMAATDTAGSLYAVPKVVADRIENIAKSRLGGTAARIFVDAPTNVWRNTVLYYRPGFYLYNVLGNVSFLKLQGGKLRRVVAQLDKRYRTKVREAIGEENLPYVEGSGFHTKTQQRATHLGAAEGTRIGGAMKAFQQAPVGRALASTTDALRRFNQHIENAFRRESFVSAAQKQRSRRNIREAGSSMLRSRQKLDDVMSEGMSPEHASRIIDEMNNTMNNYDALAPWERNILRRFFMPFWPFYRHAARTLLRLPYDHPAKSVVLDKLALMHDEFTADLGELPGYLADALPVGTEEDGDTRFQMTKGANPFSDIVGTPDEMLRRPLNLLGPIPKAIIEAGTARNTFTGNQYTDPNAVRPFGSQDQYRRDENGVPVETTVRPNILEALLSQFPQADMARDLLAGGARHSGGSGEVIDYNRDGQPDYPVDPLQELAQFFGLSTMDFNVPRYQQQEAARRAAAAQALGQR